MTSCGVTSGGSGEHVVRLPDFALEAHDATEALLSQVHALGRLGPGQGRLLLTPGSPDHTPDADGVILVDGTDGNWAVDRAQTLHLAGFHGLIVVASEAPAREVVIEGFRSGVHVWGVAPLDAEMFAANLGALAARVLGYDTEPEVPVVLNRRAHELVIDGNRIRLSPRGLTCFEYLLERRGRWVTAQEIMVKVFGTHHATDSAVVRVLVLRIRERLGSLAWVLESKGGHGYRVTLRRDSTPARLHPPHARYGGRRDAGSKSSRRR